VVEVPVKVAAPVAAPIATPIAAPSHGKPIAVPIAQPVKTSGILLKGDGFEVVGQTSEQEDSSDDESGLVWAPPTMCTDEVDQTNVDVSTTHMTSTVRVTSTVQVTSTIKADAALEAVGSALDEETTSSSDSEQENEEDIIIEEHTIEDQVVHTEQHAPIVINAIHEPSMNKKEKDISSSSSDTSSDETSSSEEEKASEKQKETVPSSFNWSSYFVPRRKYTRLSEIVKSGIYNPLSARAKTVLSSEGKPISYAANSDDEEEERKKVYGNGLALDPAGLNIEFGYEEYDSSSESSSDSDEDDEVNGQPTIRIAGYSDRKKRRNRGLFDLVKDMHRNNAGY
jgi:hypothetical protein